MPDVFTKAKRSAMMARIRGAGNKDTELQLIALMRAAGITGWRRGVRIRGRRTEGGAPASKVEGRKVESRGTPEEAPVAEAAGAYGAPLRPRDAEQSATCDLRLGTRGAARRVVIRPDFVFPKQRVAVFIDGCFFHGCPQHATWPAHNAEFWPEKILGNRAHDRRQTRLLRAAGWTVVRIWEHALTRKNAMRTLARLRRSLGA